MKSSRTVYIPSTSDIKILDTIYLLNQQNKYPLPLGVYMILSGSSKPDYIVYQDLPTYSTLMSFSSKHIARLIMMLLRNQYLEKIYDEASDDLYLKVSPKGEMFLFEYHKKHKYSFKKKKENKKPLIVEIKQK